MVEYARWARIGFQGGPLRALVPLVWVDAYAGPMKTKEMDAALQKLVDKDVIVDLVHRYSFYFDHRRFEEVTMIFTEDCVIDYGRGIAPLIQGRAELAALLSNADATGFLGTSHHNANVWITFDGPDRADVATSLYAWHHAPQGPNPRVWGYYYDKVVRAGDGWLIAYRQLRIGGQENFDIEWIPLIER